MAEGIPGANKKREESIEREGNQHKGFRFRFSEERKNCRTSRKIAPEIKERSLAYKRERERASERERERERERESESEGKIEQASERGAVLVVVREEQ